MSQARSRAVLVGVRGAEGEVRGNHHEYTKSTDARCKRIHFFESHEFQCNLIAVNIVKHVGFKDGLVFCRRGHGMILLKLIL